MKILIDTNILIDILNKRKDFFDGKGDLWYIKRGSAQAWVISTLVNSRPRIKLGRLYFFTLLCPYGKRDMR